MSNALNLPLATALVAAVMLAGCNRDADDTATITDPVGPPVATDATTEPVGTMPTRPDPMAGGAETAVDVTAVTLGTQAGTDHRITDPTTTFGTSGPIVVAVDTSGAASDAEITTRLVYQDGQTAGEESETINTTGNETTTFTFTNANDWPSGSYTAEVWVNGVQANSTKFDVR